MNKKITIHSEYQSCGKSCNLCPYHGPYYKYTFKDPETNRVVNIHIGKQLKYTVLIKKNNKWKKFLAKLR